MFKDRDIVCFFGDSITANGLYIAESYQYLRKKYKIKCYNCGVSGAIARKASGYLHSNCLIHNPDYVITLFGINDVGRPYYTKAYENEPDLEAKKQKEIDEYKFYYRKMIEDIIAFGAEPIIGIPVPYDNVNEKEEENAFVQEGMDKMCEFLHGLAQELNLKVVDFKKVMQPLLKSHDVIGPDRIHPTDYGYHIMAEIFLNAVGEKDGYDFDTPFVFEDWNKARYDAELKIKSINYVEFCATYDEGRAMNKTYEERKALARERYEKEPNKDGYIAKSCLEYIENGDNREQLLGEVIKLTIF